MKVVIEQNIPFARGVLEPYAKVDYLHHSLISHSSIADASALLTRTRTRCDAHLLRGTSVTFVGTATIGTDHIDLDYCSRAGITVANAPGCNAPAVAQWVFASIATWMRLRGISSPSGLTIGIVGVGHVGSIVERWAREIGFNVMLNDPPRARREGNDCFTSLSDIAHHAHIITFHTPLTHSGNDATHHLCNNALVSAMEHCRLVLNASRGAVCDTDALLTFGGDLAIDCWEGEPKISHKLLHKALVATPHIAGYSIEGKQRGTAMVIESLNHHFGINAPVNMPAAPLRGAKNVSLDRIINSYNPLTDTQGLKNNPDLFETLRDNYTLRFEVT